MKNKRWHKYLIFALFCGAIYFPLFLHLDWQPMNNWDESLFGMRAAYMAEEGHYLRDYSHWVEGGILHRSTKPPFTTWIQVASMKLLGINELALRLPIALCALGIVFLFLWFSRKVLGSIHIGYCAGFVLVTTLGFVREHGSRTGDQDAALAFYMMAGAMAFYQYLEAKEHRQRLGWLALLTAATIACVMTKYVFGLFFFPAFFIYAIYKKQLWNMLRRGNTWLAGLAVVLVLGGWLWHIERELPGFIRQAFFHELADRYVEGISGQKHPFGYYFQGVWKSFQPWVLLLPAPLYLIFSRKYPNKPLREFALLMLLCAGLHLLTISTSSTKTTHYDVVAYPPLAMLAGIGLYGVLQGIAHLWKERLHRPVACLAACFTCLYFVYMPYTKVLDMVYMPKITDSTMSYGYLLRKIQKTSPNYKQFTVLAPILTGQVNYYAGLLNRKQGYHIKIFEHPEWVALGDTVLVCEPQMIDTLLAKFEVKPIETHERCFLAIVAGKKEVKIEQ